MVYFCLIFKKNIFKIVLFYFLDSYLFALRLKPDAIPNIDVPYLVLPSTDPENSSRNGPMKLHHPSVLSPNQKMKKGKKSGEDPEPGEIGKGSRNVFF